jgi:hypothetical protein
MKQGDRKSRRGPFDLSSDVLNGLNALNELNSSQMKTDEKIYG